MYDSFAEFSIAIISYVNQFHIWGFLLAFLFNLSFSTSAGRTFKPALTYSLIMFFSYWLGDLLLSWNANDFYVYIKCCLFDIATIVVLIAVRRFFLFSDGRILFYLLSGLSLNVLLAFGDHIGYSVLHLGESWWYWQFAYFFIAFNDFVMILALIIHRDFLGIYRLFKFVTSGRKKAPV